MYFSKDDERPIIIGGKAKSQRNFIDDWKDKQGIPADEEKFESLLPDEEDLYSKSGDWSTGLAITTMKNGQLRNTQKGISQAFFNKTVNLDNLVSFTGGTSSIYVPEIAKIAISKFGDINWASDNFQEDIADAALGVAIKVISKIPVIGPIIAAVVAVVGLLVKSIKKNAERAIAQRGNQENDFYKNLPEFPLYRKSTDEECVRIIFESMANADWTNLFLPRYDWNREWIGIMYQSGFGFAPGVRSGKHAVDGSTFTAEKGIQLYDRTGAVCLGYIPGSQQITDMIQSWTSGQFGSVDAFFEQHSGKKHYKQLDTLWEYLQYKSPYVITSGNVLDTGDFYPSAAQIMTNMWGHLQMDGNPDLYRLDTNYIDTAWRKYCEGAYSYLTDMCQWSTYNKFNPSSSGRTIRDAIDFGSYFDRRLQMMEAVHSCSVGCYMSMYRCRPVEIGGRGANENKQDIIDRSSWRRGPGTAACNNNFNSYSKENWGIICRTNFYEGHLKQVISELRKLQFESLSKTLVCAYVRGPDNNKKEFVFGAFRGDANADLRHKLHAMRELLLKTPSQWKYLVRDDIPRDEIHNGSNWYEQLRAVGAISEGMSAAGWRDILAPQKQSPGRRAELPLGQLEKGPLPPPVDIRGRVPGMELAQPSEKKIATTSRKSSSGIPIILGAAALGILMMKGRGK